MTLFLPPALALADQIGEVTNGANVRVAIAALVINLAHAMHLGDVSLSELTALIEQQVELTRQTMETVGRMH